MDHFTGNIVVDGQSCGGLMSALGVDLLCDAVMSMIRCFSLWIDELVRSYWICGPTAKRKWMLNTKVDKNPTKVQQIYRSRKVTYTISTSKMQELKLIAWKRKDGGHGCRQAFWYYNPASGRYIGNKILSSSLSENNILYLLSTVKSSCCSTILSQPDFWDVKEYR